MSDNFKEFRDECAITTAACENFAPFLLGLINSIKANFPNHPKIYIYDLGMYPYQRKLFKNIAGLSFAPAPKLVPFWRFGYTWKPLIWQIPTEKHILHIDSGVFVLRSLAPIFSTIREEGYIAFGQNQKLKDVASPDVVAAVGIDIERVGDEEVFAAGVFGFSRANPAVAQAVADTATLATKGWALGYSEGERHRIKDPSEDIIRDCPVFRHDQTLINLCLRKYVQEVQVRPVAEYLGEGAINSHPQQFMFHHRRKVSTWDSPYFKLNPSKVVFAWLQMRLHFIAKYGRARRKFARWKGRFAQ